MQDLISRWSTMYSVFALTECDIVPALYINKFASVKIPLSETQQTSGKTVYAIDAID